MYKDIRKHESSPILYFRIVNYHERLVGNNVSVNSWQIMDLVGTEIPPKNYKKKIPDDCISYVKLKDFGFSKPLKPTESEKYGYPWIELLKSIEKLGLVIPIIAERIIESEEVCGYRAVECKHRLGAFSMLKPFNPDRLVPCLIIEYDPKKTYESHMSKKPHPHKI